MANVSPLEMDDQRYPPYRTLPIRIFAKDWIASRSMNYPASDLLNIPPQGPIYWVILRKQSNRSRPFLCAAVARLEALHEKNVRQVA
jgi:hypothetical protein